MFIWAGLKDYENFSLKKNCTGGWNAPLENFLDFKEFYRGKAWLERCEGKFVFHLVVTILENQSTGSSGNVQLKQILVSDGQPWFHIQITYPW